MASRRGLLRQQAVPNAPAHVASSELPIFGDVLDERLVRFLGDDASRHADPGVWHAEGLARDLEGDVVTDLHVLRLQRDGWATATKARAIVTLLHLLGIEQPRVRTLRLWFGAGPDHQLLPPTAVRLLEGKAALREHAVRDVTALMDEQVVHVVGWDIHRAG